MNQEIIQEQELKKIEHEIYQANIIIEDKVNVSIKELKKIIKFGEDLI